MGNDYYNPRGTGLRFGDGQITSSGISLKTAYTVLNQLLSFRAATSLKLERYVHDPKYSQHPGIAPYQLSHSVDLDLIPYDVIHLRNMSDETVEVKLDVEAVLNSECIEIVTSAGNQLQETLRCIPTLCVRSSEPIIGKSYVEEEEDEETLKKMPVVFQSGNPKKAMTPDALVAYTTMRLHSIGLSYSSLQALGKSTPEKIAVSKLLLHKTFLNNIYYRCALESEEGTAKFLCGESLSSNTTDDNCTCFSDEEAGERLHNTMSVLTPERAIDIDDSPQNLPDGRMKYTYAPETTRQRVGHVGVYRLQPGEKIVIKCPHGVKGSVTTRAYNEDGTLRRKTQKKKRDNDKS